MEFANAHLVHGLNLFFLPLRRCSQQSSTIYPTRIIWEQRSSTSTMLHSAKDHRWYLPLDMWYSTQATLWWCYSTKDYRWYWEMQDKWYSQWEWTRWYSSQRWCSTKDYRWYWARQYSRWYSSLRWYWARDSRWYSEWTR